jgi:hypothetical protein
MRWVRTPRASLRPQPTFLRGLQGVQQHIDVEGLLDELHRARSQGAHPYSLIAVSGDEYGQRVRRRASYLLV